MGGSYQTLFLFSFYFNIWLQNETFSCTDYTGKSLDIGMSNVRSMYVIDMLKLLTSVQNYN